MPATRVPRQGDRRRDPIRAEFHKVVVAVLASDNGCDSKRAGRMAGEERSSALEEAPASDILKRPFSTEAILKDLRDDRRIDQRFGSKTSGIAQLIVLEGLA